MKRGQATVFVIVGIAVVLILSGFYYFARKEGFIFGPPAEITPIVEYTQKCIESTTESGVTLMSMQGGYITIPPVAQFDPRARLDASFSVPLWLYRGRNLMPSLDTMEEELSSYIEDNLAACLLFYMPFAEQYDIKTPSLPEVKAEIADSKVYVTTKYPLQVKKIGLDKTYTYDEYDTEIATRLGYLYSAASDIMSYENSNAFLEDLTDEMMASSDYLPYEGLELSCKPKVFLVSEMKDYTQQLVMHNLHYLQFLGTDFQESGMPYYDKIYKIDFADRSYDDIKVDVVYNPAWDMKFSPYPSKDGIVKPHEYKAVSFFNTCMKIYHTKYDVEFNVLFSLTEPDGEAFYFASPVVLKRSLPDRYNSMNILDAEESVQYCENSTEVTSFGLLENGQMTTTPSTMNNRQNKLGVYAVDALYGYPQGALLGANISYQCVRFKCRIGETAYPRFQDLIVVDAYPQLSTGFPECDNGIIIAEKEGYHTAYKHQTVSPGTNGEQVMVDMYRLKPFGFSIKVVEDHNGIVSERDLKNNETALITLINPGQLFEKTLLFPSDSEYFNDLDLLVGDFTYQYEVLLTKDTSLLGGAHFNWTPSLNDITAYDDVVFYVYKKDPLSPPQSVEEMYNLYKTSLKESPNYPPRFR